MPVAAAAATLAVLAGVASASKPPARVLRFDPLHGTIGGFGPGDRLSGLPRVFGAPDLRVNPGGGPVWLWLRVANKACSDWAEALADGAHRTRIGDLVYRGAIVTAKGDRLGTPLRVVRRHWPGWKLVSRAGVGGSQGPNYGHATRFGSVAFGFDAHNRLAGVAVRGSAQYWQPIVLACR
jgi:hypothetical protein